MTILSMAGTLLLATASVLAAEVTPSSTPNTKAETHPAAALLPPGTHTVRVMDLRPSVETAVLSGRFRESAERHREWLFNYIKERAKPGEPLPYHANFGLDGRSELPDLSGIVVDLANDWVITPGLPRLSIKQC